MLRILSRNIREKFFLVLPMLVAIWVFIGILTVIHRQEVYNRSFQTPSQYTPRKIRKSIKAQKRVNPAPMDITERLNPFRYLPGFHKVLSIQKQSHTVYLSDSNMERIGHRFENRRKRLTQACAEQSMKPVLDYSNITHQSFLFNHIFHEENMGLSGCIPPKTGSTSWNHFWWGASLFNGDGPGKFNSFQMAQLNQTKESMKPNNDRMVSLEDWIDLLTEKELDKKFDFDIHFHSYEYACFPCRFPYQYIIRLETFAEDYQYVLRKINLWDGLTEDVKKVGSIKENESIGLDYIYELKKLPSAQRQKLYEMKKDELKMFGYFFDPELVEIGTLSE